MSYTGQMFSTTSTGGVGGENKVVKTDANGQVGQSVLQGFGEDALVYDNATDIPTDLTKGNLHTVTLTGNSVLLNPINGLGGETHTWRITQDTV